MKLRICGDFLEYIPVTLSRRLSLNISSLNGWNVALASHASLFGLIRGKDLAAEY